jgi:transcriptional regulator GlxA family with amidase domain
MRIEGAARSRFGVDYDQIESELRLASAEHQIISPSFPREVTAVLDLIHGRPFEPSLNVNAVKRDCRLRNNNISTRFRTFVGFGIREYIERLRLEAARHLLECCDIDIYLVALVVGYEHQETFCRAFHRRFGVPASEYRRGLTGFPR